MLDIFIPEELRKTDPGIRIAVLDGTVDLNHSCFTGARLTAQTCITKNDVQAAGAMTIHGTHVTSIIFGQPQSLVVGLAAHCTGIIIPVFSDKRASITQLDLSRAIEQAVDAGVHIINISGGQLSDSGEAEVWLTRAVELCAKKNILIVAAAGNDGCNCVHVPAALPATLAVGAMNANGQPLEFSNWGGKYKKNGILAPGENILGAIPGNKRAHLSGTSSATPIVSAAAALLLSYQIRMGHKPNPGRIREILLGTSAECVRSNPKHKCLAGRLDIGQAFAQLKEDMAINNRKRDLESSHGGGDPSSEEQSRCTCQQEGGQSVDRAEAADHQRPAPSSSEADRERKNSEQTSLHENYTKEFDHMSSENHFTADLPAAFHAKKQQVNPPGLNSSSISQTSPERLAYALGVIGYDFGTEARRDTFRQLMPATAGGANPHDPRQMSDYIESNITEANSLIWTLNIEQTPVYAIEPHGVFAREAYQALQKLLKTQLLDADDDNYVERASIPGTLTGKSVRLFSGQTVPVIEVSSPRGIYGWKVNSLVQHALAAMNGGEKSVGQEQVRKSLSNFLNRVYYDLRNLGTTADDRALNFAVTNVFQVASVYCGAVADGLDLDQISVEKSPFGRMDSSCWDVKLKFFDPENNRRAKRIYRFTVDVNDVLPVSVGEVASWTSAD